MSIGFHKIDDSIVVVRHGKLYKQVGAYQRGGKVYAKIGGGYARMLGTGNTTHPDVNWLECLIDDKEIKPSSKLGAALEYKNDTK